jgi:hypothetical protein
MRNPSSFSFLDRSAAHRGGHDGCEEVSSDADCRRPSSAESTTFDEIEKQSTVNAIKRAFKKEIEKEFDILRELDCVGCFCG